MEFRNDTTPHMFSMDQFETIVDAGDKQQMIRITYTDSKGNVTVRTVEPYEIKEGKLYAFCTTKQSMRAFKLERFQLVEQTEESFEPRYPVKLSGDLL